MRNVGEVIIEQEYDGIFWYKGSTSGQKGVGLIIRNSVKYMVHEITAVSERILVLVLTAKRSSHNHKKRTPQQQAAANKKYKTFMIY